MVMPKYLEAFNRKLKKRWRGSLTKVEYIKDIEPNAREYMHNLARAGYIEHIKHGWYWVPDDIDDFFDFLRTDKNFKVVSAQTAASFWNNDFVHRNVYTIKVKDESYGKALESFAEKRGWLIEIKIIKKDIPVIKKYGLNIEDIPESIIDCLQAWAFVDAFSVLYLNRNQIKLKELSEKAYWKRLSKTSIRIRQILEYGSEKMNELAEEELCDVRGAKIEDDFVRRELDEAIEKVVAFA